MIRSVFDSAFMEIVLDSDGDVIVKDTCNVFVLPSKEKKKISLLAHFGFEPSSSRTERLEAVNKINVEYLFVRASVHEETLRFNYDICLDGGIPKKALVLTLKRFASIPHAAVEDHAMRIVV
jgi:hypothetical protein